VNAYQLGDKNYFFEISAYPSGDGISVFTKDITERVQAQDALRESEEKYRALVENSPDGIFISDAERLIYTNKRLCEMTGFTQDEFLDMLDPVEMLFAPEERERVLAFAMGRLRGDPVPTSYKARGVRKGGEEILLRLTVSPIVLSGRPVLQGTVEDITERVRAAEEVRRRNRELALLNRVIATTTSTLDVEQVLQIACQELANTFDLPQAAATLLNAERSEAIVVAEYLAPGRPSALGKIISVVDNPATEYVLARKTSLAVTDAQTDERMAPVHDLMRERGTVSLLIVPVMERDEVVGTIGLDAIERRGFSDEEITLAQNVAAAAGQALETARLYQELQRHTAELARALEKQQELDRLRSEFVRNVSHEVRTPLALVRGHAELLEVGVLGELRPEQQESVVVIARRTRALTKIMDDFAAIVDVETKLQRRPVDMAELVHEMLTDSQVQAAVERASLTLAVEAVPDLSPMSGDPIQLRRVVDNLLDNALKFTPTGGHVVVRLWQEGENLVLKVSDTGIGIPRDQLERVFERFYQIDGSTTRRYGGTGLGLALVKEIVQAHRGQVTVQSTIGQGSTFTVTLPIDSVHPSHHT
jgi:PAS domain S-box-containing protein